MTDVVRASFDQAARRWPGVALDYDDFAAHVEAKVRGADPAGLQMDDLYLALSCARGDAAAIETLEREVLAQVGTVLRTLDTRGEFADEVKQKLRERLLIGTDDGAPRLLDYAGRGALVAWVNVGAIRVGLNLLRSEQRRGRHEQPDWSRALVAADTGDPELEAFKLKHREQFQQAITGACADLDDRQRNILRLHFLDGLSIDRIGVVYSVHRSTAARWIARARDRLHEATRTRLIDDHGISESQASFVERLVLSQLEVSFSQLLAVPDDE